MLLDPRAFAKQKKQASSGKKKPAPNYGKCVASCVLMLHFSTSIRQFLLSSSLCHLQAAAYLSHIMKDIQPVYFAHSFSICPAESKIKGPLN